LDIRTVFEPPLLLAVLNTLLISVVSFAVAYIAARSYMKRGLGNILILGGGVLAFGLGNLIAGCLVASPGGPNAAVAVHNTAALLGSVLHVLGAVVVSAGVTAQGEPVRRRLTVITAYLFVLGAVGAVTLASLSGALPTFFIQGIGPTLLRQYVLGTAVALFAVSSLLFMKRYSKLRGSFLYWYSLGLGLIALGLSAVFFQKAVGSLIGWAGRSAQYLGGIYFFIAVAGATKRARTAEISLGEAIGSFFRDAEQQYKTLVETTSDAIISLDREGKVLLWNSAAEKMFGYERGEAVGSYLAELIAPNQHGGDRENDLEKALQEPPTGGRTETAVRRKDGEIFPAELSFSKRGTAGGPTATLILRDITKRRQAAEALRRARDELEERVQERTRDLLRAVETLEEEVRTRRRLEAEVLRISEFEKKRIGQDIHDSIGQMLCGISCLSRALSQKLAGKNMDEAKDAAGIESVALDSLEQMRLIARGLSPLAEKPDSLMMALKELASYTEAVLRTGCTVECDEAVPIEDAVIATQVYRIAQEAVTNAVRHGKARNITLGLTFSHNRVVLTVKDDGVGIPEEASESLGMGFRTMRHRAEAIRASLDIRRSPEGGTIVRCCVRAEKAR
jgi:PAS domain S-box-containing protein